MKKTILIVDDELANIEMTVGALRGGGYELLVAENGRQALTLASRRLKPDLILLDVMMPGMDGFEVCRRLKEDPGARDIPVIFVTALKDAEKEAQGLKLGAVDYICKPCSLEIMAARVRTHLELHEHQTELERLVAERTAELKTLNKQLLAEVEARRLAEMALSESEQRLREVLDNLPGVGVYRMDEQGEVLWMNQELLRMLGYDARAMEAFKPDASDLPPSSGQGVAARLRSGDERDREVRIQCGDGCRRVFACTNVSRRVGIPGWINWGVAVDVTGLKEVEEELRKAHGLLEQRVDERTRELSEANQQLQREIGERRKVEEALQREKDFIDSVLATSHDGIAVVTASGETPLVSPGMERLFGYSADELEGLDSWIELLTPEGAKSSEVKKLVIEALDASGPVERTFRFQHGSGEMRHCRLHISRMQNGNLVINGHDLTEIRAAQERIRHMALHDPLTGLPNRQLFSDRIEHAFRRARRNNSMLGLLYVDLDRFKAMNDTHGHAFGDAVLCEAGRLLTENSRESDTVARIGGDEFVLLLQDLESPDQALPVAKRVVEGLNKPEGAGSVYLLGASVGVAVHPRDGDTPEALLQAADRAMYRAKGMGGNRYWPIC
jgi:diguanylate cyclase (GGDEF)-like protein/PAS domain S-box-containing protein